MSVVNGTNGLGAEGSLEMSNGMDGMDSVAAHVDDEVGTGTLLSFRRSVYVVLPGVVVSDAA